MDNLKPYPLCVEIKSRRLQLVMQPSLYERVEKGAVDNRLSVNKYIHQILDEATRNYVVRGRWRYYGTDRFNDYYRCPECEGLATDDSAYCPNCGAKMDLEEKNE